MPWIKRRVSSDRCVKKWNVQRWIMTIWWLFYNLFVNRVWDALTLQVIRAKKRKNEKTIALSNFILFLYILYYVAGDIVSDARFWFVLPIAVNLLFLAYSRAIIFLARHNTQEQLTKKIVLISISITFLSIFNLLIFLPIFFIRSIGFFLGIWRFWSGITTFFAFLLTISIAFLAHRNSQMLLK